MVGGYTENPEIPQNCQNWGMGACPGQYGSALLIVSGSLASLPLRFTAVQMSLVASMPTIGSWKEQQINAEHTCKWFISLIYATAVNGHRA